MHAAGFSPDMRNIGGRNIIVDGLVAHAINLRRIHRRTPDSRKRLASQVKSTRKNNSKCSKNSDTKSTYGLRQEESKERRREVKPVSRRPVFTHSNCAIKTSYNELDLGAVQRDYSNKALIEGLKEVDMWDGQRAERRIFKQLINHVVKQRIIKDEQFDQLFVDLVNAFPHHEERLKAILVEVVTALDY